MSELSEAELEMQIAYIDWQDNTASDYFRNLFFDAQERYKLLKENNDE